METLFLAETDAVVNAVYSFWSPVAGFWSLVAGFYSLVSGVRCQVAGPIIFDTRYLMLDTGFWSTVEHSAKRIVLKNQDQYRI